MRNADNSTEATRWWNSFRTELLELPITSGYNLVVVNLTLTARDNGQVPVDREEFYRTAIGRRSRA